MVIFLSFYVFGLQISSFCETEGKQKVRILGAEFLTTFLIARKMGKHFSVFETTCLNREHTF